MSGDRTPVSVQGARLAARRLYPRSRGFQGAYVRGWRAGARGRSHRGNPYRLPTPGWSCVWRAAWMRGWLAGARAREATPPASG